MSTSIKILNRSLIGMVFVLFVVSCAPIANMIPGSQPSGPGLAVASDPTLGNILVDSSTKMTLYIFTKDTPGVSNCSGQCAVLWPPYIVPAGATPSGGSGITATLTTITRADGTLQLAVNGMPVYFWAKDKKAGDVTGQGVGGVWFVLDPSGSQIKTALPAASK
jgi:predicted lipoprotein with Yx(FWY)xxD motif